MLTERKAAEAIRDGLIDSPQKFGEMWLFAIRITGTGLTYRVGLNEYCWRDPSLYLNEQFCERCAGLPVIWQHPKKAGLNSEEFGNRVIGAVMLAYLIGDEVWAIARVYDADCIDLMRKKQLSTSPGFLFGDNDLGLQKKLDDGTRLYVEGDPIVLDHIAVCDQGVWDKGGDPTGVDIGGSSVETDEAKENARKDAEEKARLDAEEKARNDAAAGGDIHSKLSEILDCLGTMRKDADGLKARLDSIEKGKPGDTKEADEMRAEAERQDKARKDAEEKERMDADDMKKRMDALESAVKPRADADESEMAEEQGRMDSVYQAFGQRAPAPLPGEMPNRYRARLATGLKQHSKAWQGVDLSGLSPDVLKLAANQIRNDAVTAADHPTIADDQLIARTRHEGGHTVTRYIGSYDAGNSMFKRRMQRVTSFDAHRGRAV